MSDALLTDDSRDRRLDKVLAEYLRAIEAGQTVDRTQLLAKHPELADDLRSFFQNRDAMQRLAEPLRGAGGTSADDATIGLTGLPLEGGSRVRYFGDYELLDEIARGGMGVVYKARQVSLNRTVAVKMILAGQLAGDEDVKRFRAEAEAAAKLDHPCIVPIYEIGQQAGQHYFSMAFIDGESLAERVARGVMAPKDAATILLKAARAIAYAHAAGVVHRDLKPANILIDRAGEPHVTDFGLAKQLSAPTFQNTDDGAPAPRSNLTGTGQILGTPSYMSPEQAAGKGALVGPPADIYSLGSVLYCLVTGRPPFQTASPVDTLLQVIHDEPASPRLLNPAVPRDLETICLKCLDKEPRRRYGSAQELADELERYLHDEPILARPPDLAERAWRWLRKQQRSVMLTATAVAATLVLAIVSVVGWAWYQEWQLGRILLKTDRPPIVAELIDERGATAGPTFTVPTQEPVAVAADEYQLRLTAPARLSQTYRTTIERGAWPATFNTNLEEQVVGIGKDGATEMRIDKSYAVISRPDNDGIVLLNENGIQHMVWYEWTLPLDKPSENAAFKDAPGFRWPWYKNSSYEHHALVAFHPHVMREAPDVDGDGIRDVIVAARHQAWVMAVSVSNGQVVWLAARGQDALSVAEDGRPPYFRNPSAVLAMPLSVPDRDGDGVMDLLVIFADEQQKVGEAAAPRRWVECLSGKAGKTIWSYEFAPQWFDLPTGNAHPHASLWFTTVGGWSNGGGSYSNDRGEITRDMGSERLSGHSHPVPFPLTLLESPSQTIIATVAGARAVALDLATGKLAWPPLDLGLPLMTAPKFANLAGDDQCELLVVQPVPGQTTIDPNGSYIPTEKREMTIAAWSLGSDGRLLWQHGIHAERRPPWKVVSPDFPWPVVEDLDADGRAEVVVPNRSLYERRLRMTPEIEALDGASGKARWRRAIKNMDGQFDLFVAGPDINGDGTRDVFAAALVGENFDLFIDALSGKDGKSLWWYKHAGERESFLERMTWWHAGGDGWPQLLVTTIPGQRDSKQPLLYLLSAATGQLASRMAGVDAIEFGNADTDGLTDLFTFQRTNAYYLSLGGKLQAIRGVADERWRRLGGNWRAADDYNGDGHADLLTVFPSGTPQVAALSGDDGKQLWRTTLRFPPGTYDPQPRPLSVDLNDDAVADLLVYRQTSHGGSSGRVDRFPLAAVSGRTGAVIWNLTIEHGSTEGVLFTDVRDLDGDGKPELIFSTFTDWDYARGTITNSSAWSQHWLAVVDARSGAFRWRKPLSAAYGATGAPAQHFDEVKSVDVQPAFADLNADGVLDILMPAEDSASPGAFEMRATSGRDGVTLWQRPLALPNDTQNSPPLDVRHFWQDAVTPAIGDLEGDGKSEVISLEYFFIPAQAGKPRQRQARLFALDAATGAESWTWQTEVPEFCGIARDDRPAQLAKPTPRIVTRKGSRPLVALGLWGGNFPNLAGKLGLFDHTGQLVASREIAMREPFKVWVFDVDADGHDELLYVDSKRLYVVRVVTKAEAVELATLWELPLGYGTPWGLLDILSATDRRPATIVTQAGNVVRGLAEATGKPLWIINGTQPDLPASAMLPPLAQLLSRADGAPPATLFQWGDQATACHLPRSVDEKHVRPVSLPPQVSAIDDPRIVRRPIWSPDAGGRREGLVRLAWGIALSIVLIVLPARTLYRMIAERRWGVRTMFVLPLIVGLMLLVLKLPVIASIEPTFYISTVRFRWQHALLGLPIVVFVSVLLGHAWNGRFRKLGLWALTIAILGALISIGAVITEGQRLSPGERLSLADWDIPLAYGFYTAATLATGAVLGNALIRLVRPTPPRKAEA